MDQFFLAINSWMGQGLLLGGLGCFLWGMVSVLFSPCHLASIPLIVGYVGGQNHLLEGRRATLYAIVFTTGLFMTIAVIGLICSLLGRMLGDVGPYWTIVIGLLLLWVALDMLGVAKCSLSGGLMSRFDPARDFPAPLSSVWPTGCCPVPAPSVLSPRSSPSSLSRTNCSPAWYSFSCSPSAIASLLWLPAAQPRRSSACS